MQLIKLPFFCVIIIVGKIVVVYVVEVPAVVRDMVLLADIVTDTVVLELIVEVVDKVHNYSII